MPARCRRSWKVRSGTWAGTVALTDRVRVVACPGDSSSSFCFCLVRRLPVPTGGDPVGGALVPPLRAVVPRCRGAARRAWRGRRSRHDLQVGATLHPAGHQGCSAVPAQRRRAVDQYGQVIDVFVSKRRNVAASTEFFEMMLAGRERPREVTTDLAAPLLRVVDDLLPDALPDTTQVCEQPDRMRPRSAEGTAAADARSAHGSDRVDGDPRSCVRPESATRPLRTFSGPFRAWAPTRGLSNSQKTSA